MRRLTCREEDVKVALLDEYRLAWNHTSTKACLDHRSIPSFDSIWQFGEVGHHQSMTRYRLTQFLHEQHGFGRYPVGFR